MIMKTMKITDHNKKRKVNNTRMEEGETLTGYGTIFFVNPQEFWGQTTLVFGLLKLEFHSDSTKNTSLVITFVS